MVWYDGITVSIVLLSFVLWLLLGLQWRTLRRVRIESGQLPVTNRYRLCHRLIQLLALNRELTRFKPLSEALCQVLPLLGLLGTVSGMITVFSEMATYSREQGMQVGISQALLSTFAGLTASVPALFCLHYLTKQRQACLTDLQKSVVIGRKTQ